MQEVLERLPPRDRTVVELRFGFDCEPHALQEVGAVLGVAREGVRHVEQRAMVKLRAMLAKSPEAPEMALAA
jgi:RNA polymerase primary sigma factor